MDILFLNLLIQSMNENATYYKKLAKKERAIYKY
jgi:hypothetical protein